MLGPDLAEHDVAVGDGERPAAPVAGRAGHRAGAVRADPEAAARQNAQTEPPPAATVWISSIGARTRTPATTRSLVRS